MSAAPLRTTEPRPRPVSTVAGALWREYEKIHGTPPSAALGCGPDASLQAYYQAALGRNQAALCLSGGGIRSGAFSLGVIQALAKRRLLSQFDYLSTVSGGGYIGAWLLAMLQNRGGDPREVEAALADRVAPPELKRLRAYTNYLSPQFGLFSPDTWAGITLWVRNVLVNWMIFLPGLLALAVVPDLYVDLIKAIAPGWSIPLLVIGLLCLGLAVFEGTLHLPSHAEAMAATPADNRFSPQWVVLPVIAWSILVPLIAAPWLRQTMPEGALIGDVIPLLAFVVMELGYVAAALCRCRDRLYWHNFGWWTLASLAATVLLWLALDFGIARRPEIVAILGPLAVTVAHLVQSLVFVALRTEAYRGDLDREWLARLSAEKVAPTLIWAIFAAVCLLLPGFVLDGWSTRFVPFVVCVFGVLTGPAAAYLGKVSKDVPGRNIHDTGAFVPVGGMLGVLPDLLAAVFAAALFMLLARLGTLIADDDVGGTLFVLLVSLGIAVGLGKHINVNRFSMHGVYRIRLVSGFLGPPRPTRHPDPYTGVDPQDNPRMSDVFARPADCRKLFPVINTTLNLVSTRNTAWAERKAESFTITPVACGGAFLQRIEDRAAGLPARGAYVPTEKYGGNESETGPGDEDQGISLGTAMTISGAAVSPSMGYHSSAATAFLMTLFNVRLGAWLPNPATASREQLQAAKPPNALVTLTRELLGRTNDQGRAVYLSDGGHFENLGIYEMVRRRCRYIFVVDAGEDAHAFFEDLGNAVRKIRIDFDIRIEFAPPVGIGSRSNPVDPFRSFAWATIHYPDIGADPGYLIYLKPSYPPDMAIDVRAYGNLNEAFPHETTIDQFFTESRFESYRQLGENEANELVCKATGLRELFTLAQTYLAPPDLLADTTC